MLLSSTACIFDDYDVEEEPVKGGLLFRVISPETKLTYDDVHTNFVDGDVVGCVIAAKDGESYGFRANTKWTYSDNVLMLAEGVDGLISHHSDQIKASQGYVELTDQGISYAFFFYYPYMEGTAEYVPSGAAILSDGNWTSYPMYVHEDFRYTEEGVSSQKKLFHSDHMWVSYTEGLKGEGNITQANANYPVNLTFSKKMATIDIHCDKNAEGEFDVSDFSISSPENGIYRGAAFDMINGVYSLTGEASKNNFVPAQIKSDKDGAVYRLILPAQTFVKWQLNARMNGESLPPISLEDQFKVLEEGKLYILHIAPKGDGSIVINDWQSGAFTELVPDDIEEIVGPKVTIIENASRNDRNDTEVTARPGETITLYGYNLDLVGKLRINDQEIEVTAADDGSTITFTFPVFPAEVKWSDGDIILITGTEYADVSEGTELGACTYVLPVPTATYTRNGTTLILTGNDLDLVKTLGMPGNTEAQFTHVSANELRVDMGECKTDPYVYAGDITLTTDYAEPVSTVVPYDEMPQFHSFSTSSLSHGDELVITGRDLDLVNCVIFEDNVDDNVVYTRGTCNGETELHVIVPPGAQTGKVVMRLVYGMIRVETSPTELTVVQPATEDIRIWEDTQGMESDDQLAKEGYDHKVYHTVDSELLANESYKGPESLVHYYDWTDVEEGDVLIICVDKTENWADWNFGIRYLDGDAYGNHIDLYGNPYGYTASPITNTSGVMIRLTSAMIENIKTNGFVIDVPESGDGQKCRVDKILIRKLQINPTVSAVFNFRPGGTTTVNGTNLDKIAYATVPGPGSTTLTINVFNVSADKTSMTFTLPETTCDGTMYFYDAGGNQISSGTFTVEKPSFSSFNGQTSVAVGESLTIKGNNLDLVKSVTFSGGITVNVTPTDSQTIVVSVPSGAQTGQIMLNMANGTQVPTDSITISEPVVAVPEILNDRREGTDVYFSGTNLDQVRQIYINGNAQAFELVGDEIRIAGSAMGINGTARFVYDSGEVSYDFNYSPKITGVTDEKGNAITSADPGQKIIIKGENLDLANLVQFNGSDQYVRVNTALGQTDASLTVTVPAGASGSTYIRLRDIMGGYDDGLGVRDLAVNQLDGNEVDVWNGSIVYSDWNLVNVGDYVIVYVNPSNNSSDWSFQLNGNPYTNSTGVMIQLDQTSLNYLRNNGGFKIGDISTNNCQVSRVTVLKKQAAGGLELVFAQYSPNPVQAGHELVIYISNSDYIASVLFSGCSEYVTGRSESNREYKVTVPNEAVTGRVTLKLTDGSTMELPDLTITGSVVTPSINSISRVGWEQLIIEGTNFSDATEVTLNGQSLVLYTHYDLDGNRITIYQNTLETYSNRISGSVTLDGTVTESYDFTPEVTTSLSGLGVKRSTDRITIEVNNLDLVNSVLFSGSDGNGIAGLNMSKNSNYLEITIPEGAVTGPVTLVCVDNTYVVTDGNEITITIDAGGSGGGGSSTEEVLWEPVSVERTVKLSSSLFAEVTEGDVIIVNYNYSGWAQLYFSTKGDKVWDDSSYIDYTTNPSAEGEWKIELTGEMINKIKSVDKVYFWMNADNSVTYTSIKLVKN